MPQPGKIVIADDNRELCDVIIRILAGTGYEAEAVYNGYELLHYLENNNPAVIILDLMMPEKDGLSIINTLKQVSPYSRIIIYTGYQEYEKTIYARIADRFLVKGTDMKELVSAVGELV